MITINQILRSQPVMEAMIYARDEQPVYARVNGALYQIDGVEAGQLLTAAGQKHDVIILAVSEQTGTEAA